MKIPKIEEIEDEPCLKCFYSEGCQIECLVFEYWSDTGKVPPNIFEILCLK